jgi:hypothetical protein
MVCESINTVNSLYIYLLHTFSMERDLYNFVIFVLVKEYFGWPFPTNNRDDEVIDG